MPEKNVNHQSLKENAYHIIKNKLLNLEIAPGSRIREDFIAEEISMSRTPVREAISLLVSEGLIRWIPRKGLFFIDLSLEEINDLIDVRCALEALAVTLCIDRIDEDIERRLEEIIKSAEESLAKADYVTCNEMDSLFHKEIAWATGNQMLIRYLEEIEDFMHIARSLEKKTQAKQKSICSVEQHWYIFKSIKARNKEEAREGVIRNVEQLRLHLGVEP
jgi:DNA-binding GntR family transcriptional regulator